MSFIYKNSTKPLFVNSSQIRKYGRCGPYASTAATSERDADHWNFSSLSALPSIDVSSEQSAKACVNDSEFHYKPDSVSPIFGRQKRPEKLLSNCSNSVTVDDSMRTVGKGSAFTPCVHGVDESSKILSLSESEDSDRASPVLNSRTYKRRRRLQKRRVVIDSDDSDDHSSDCGEKAYKTSFSNYSSNNDSQPNKVESNSNIQRFSALEHRHCFDLLFNRGSPNTVTHSNVMQSVQRSYREPVSRNDECRHSTKSCSQSPCESVDGSISDESDANEKDAIDNVTSHCSVNLCRLQLRDVPHTVLLSQEDNLLLSGRCSSADSCKTSTVNSDNQLPVSSDLIRLSEVDGDCGSAVQSARVHYCSSDDLFSDNELVESVCLSPSNYCSTGEQTDHGISKPSRENVESTVMSKQPEVPFVSYSQAEDDCILIDDSDDELFANLTQKDMTIKDEHDQSDDDEECGSADDDTWVRDDADGVTPGDSRNRVGEMSETLKALDPWISDVADVSSDELEEAYNAAMSHAHLAEGRGSLSTDSATVNQQFHDSDDDAVTVSDANLKLLSHSAGSECNVLVKRLRLGDIPPEIQLSHEQKHLCEADIVVVDDETHADYHSDLLCESVRSKPVSCRVNSGTTYEDRDKDLAVSAEIYRKPDAVLKSSDLTEFVDFEKLPCSETFAEHGRETDSDAVASVKDTVSNEWRRTPSSCEKINKLSVRDTDKVVQNVDAKHKSKRRIALEQCVEVAEFYGTSVRRASKENRQNKHDLEVDKDVAKSDTVDDTKSKNSASLHCSKNDQSHWTMSAPPLNLDMVKSGDDSACEEEQPHHHTSLMQNFSTTTSSLQYQKIAQMRDITKQKLRRDKTSLPSRRRLLVDDCSDRFMGLSQFSVAKQQLVERNRQLKTNGPSVRAKRDRQYLVKNKPQLDDEPGRDGDMQLQYVEPSVESLPSHTDTLVDSSILTTKKRKSTDVSSVVRNETSNLQVVEDSCSGTHVPVVDKADSSIDTSVSNQCSNTRVTNTNSHIPLLADPRDAISATKTSNTASIVRPKDAKRRLLSTAVSDQPLPKKAHSQASKAKSVDCSRLPPSAASSHYKTVNKKSLSRKLTAEGSHGEGKHSSSLRSNFADNIGKTISYSCDSELKTVQSDESSAVNNSSKAVVGASDSDLNTAKNVAASREQNVSVSANRQSTGNCVTLGSVINATMHQTATPHAMILVPNVVRQPQSSVRFEDIVMPSSHLPVAKTDSLPQLSVDNCLLAVLNWNPNWLHEYATNKMSELPPVVNLGRVYPLLETYDSYADYFNIVQQLLLLDTWESLFKEWKEQSDPIKYKLAAGYLEVSQDRMTSCLYCQAAVKSNGLKEGDLVILTLRRPADNDHRASGAVNALAPEKRVFGYVRQTQRYNLRSSEQLHPLISEQLRQCPNLFAVKYVILLKHRKYPIDDKIFTDAEHVASVVTTVRQFAALVNLPHNHLARDILRPINKHVFIHNLNPSRQRPANLGHLNSSQVSAVSCITNAVLQPYVSSKICLLQGPPGTGKSLTTIALVENILAQKNADCRRILLCTPSNAGIDELCRRLKQRNAQRAGISFVRVGNVTSVHDDIKRYCLSELARDRFRKLQQPQLSSIRRDQDELQKKIGKLQKQRDQCVSANKLSEVGRIDSELAKCRRRMQAFNPKLKEMNAGDEQRMKREVLLSVSVVCTTLNHSGSSLLLDVLKPFTNSGRATVPFGCIIVDEACQCTEMDNLIPLQYSSTKLVLVGDPEQLPPTVLSKMAAEKNYGQSLFERLYSQFRMMEHSPIMMLTTQYRMHQDICMFPNKHVYGGFLLTDPEVAKKRTYFPFQHYTVFDLQDSRDELDAAETSVYNRAEADFIVMLCSHLGVYFGPKKILNNIGIITPYRRQQRILKDQLAHRSLGEIEVGTVDGFQGREKDVIILSCVRANRSGTIGFLEDRRRLNVSLTRARYALYIVGHMQTLRQANADWSALAADAAKRKRIVSVASMRDAERLIVEGCSNNQR